MEDFGIGVTTDLSFEQAVMRARIALRSRGFSVLSEMPAPLDPEQPGRRHLFMGLWEELISTANLGGPGMDVGDHLPVNVVVFEEGDGTTIAALDPTEGLEGWAHSDLAGRALLALQAALADIEGSKPDA